MFKGSIAAIITPMQEDGSLDFTALQNLIEWHIASHTDGLVVNGTTGESATLDPAEQYDLLTFVIKLAAGRIPVIAGTGTNSTSTTLKLTENARHAKADACLVVTPYYNKPTQKGLYEHYKAIAKAVSLPMILYNVPGRTCCDLLPETVAELAKIPSIIGIKEATGKIDRAQEITACCDKAFRIYSGDDPSALDLMLNGASGVISVTANVAPRQMHDLCKAALTNDIETAKNINNRLAKLHQHLFLESNPIPTKWALQKMGKISPGIRLPLLTLDSRYHQLLTEAMEQAGVI